MNQDQLLKLQMLFGKEVRERQRLHGIQLFETETGTLIAGAGAAGLKAAVSLANFGEKDLLLVSEDLSAGTSRNTGSDKQTYYKLSLAGDEKDSVRAMAEDLFSGGCVDGEHALSEAALSVRSFYHLSDIGVPFPENDYGESVGYQTDHDTRGRASSVGPYTSRMMTEALFREAENLGIRMIGGLQLIRIPGTEDGVRGALFLWRMDKETQEPPCFLLIYCTHLILATGGPAAIYRDSVYPLSQHGASGVAFLSGVRGRNLTEWQFGMASVKPRWNVSGSYMQVLPRFVSVAADGSDAREFLKEYYEEGGELLRHTFLKGYEWPFDADKLKGGSSLIDLFVFEETVIRGRRVFLDYRKDPEALAGGFPEEAYAYLSRADALGETPVLRLKKLNEPAYRFYLAKGVDLEKEMLEIRISAQHNNGGLLVDAHWETNVAGIYAIGEAACTHGVRRPGGSALNAGQVGAYRAAEHIAFSEESQRRRIMNAKKHQDTEVRNTAGTASADLEAADEAVMNDEVVSFLSGIRFSSKDRLDDIYQEAQARMSRAGGMIRNEENIREALSETEEKLTRFFETTAVSSPKRLSLLFRLYDVLITQKVYLSAMLDYIMKGGGSRGSALYTDAEGIRPHPLLADRYMYSADNHRSAGITQEMELHADRCESFWRPVHPIPEAGLFFESEWKKFRERRSGVSPSSPH